MAWLSQLGDRVHERTAAEARVGEGPFPSEDKGDAGMNPFDMRGPDFLQLYLVVLMVVIKAGREE